MVDVRALENSTEFVQDYKKSLTLRGADPSILDELLALNFKRKQAALIFETNRAEQNRIGQEIAKLKRNGQDAAGLMTQSQSLAEKIKIAQSEVEQVETELRALSLVVPNKLHPSVPSGKSAEQNVLVRSVGSATQFGFKAKDHVELGENLGILDFERAGKITGARFVILKGMAARLERALIQLMMDVHSDEHGYEEMIPPFIVNSNSLVGTGQFPKFRDDVFHLEGFDMHLVPTAEVPVTNIYGGETLEEEKLPICYAAYTPCFRSEAGSYGRDTRGLIRQHQFNKVELLKFTTPETSYEEHEKLTKNAEAILKKLELPYRVMSLCSGDIGFGAAKCYDLEVWLPSQNGYREISSCSNFEDFQARRAEIRYRPKDKGKPRYVHTINGSGLAVGRTLIAILENYQTEAGQIQIPAALKPYIT